MTWLTAAVRSDDLEELARLLGSGAIEPVIEATHPLDELPTALAHVGEGHARGKIVITVRDRPRQSIGVPRDQPQP